MDTEGPQLNHLVTLSTNGEHGTRDRSFWLDKLIGVCKDKHWEAGNFIWTYKRLSESHLFRGHKKHFSVNLGYWLWKPYIILDALLTVNNGDTLMWMDSDLIIGQADILSEMIGSLSDDNDMIFFYLTKVNGRMTTEQCFELMGMTETKYKEAYQVWAALHLWKKTARSQKFCLDWLSYCFNPDILISGIEYGDYKHRWDQSILTNMIVHEGIKPLSNEEAQVCIHPPN